MERSNLSGLHPDLLRLIGRDLLPMRGRNLVNLCLTNRFLNQVLCGSPEFWRFLYKRDLSDTPPKDQDFKRVYLDFYRETRSRSQIDILRAGARWGLEKIVDQILEEIQGFDSDTKLKYYNYAMTWAAKGGHLEIVKLMLKLGANDYLLAMWEAACERHPEIVEYIRQWPGFEPYL